MEPECNTDCPSEDDAGCGEDCPVRADVVEDGPTDRVKGREIV